MPNRKVSDDGSSRFTVTLPAPVTARLKAIAAERGTKLAIVMREAAYLLLKQYDRDAQPRRRAS